MSRRWRERVSSRGARLATAVLLALQLGGCALDLVTEQIWVESFFCLAAPGGALADHAAAALWLVLASSWIAGCSRSASPACGRFTGCSPH